jgi:hypothetical protein
LPLDGILVVRVVEFLLAIQFGVVDGIPEEHLVFEMMQQLH